MRPNASMLDKIPLSEDEQILNILKGGSVAATYLILKGGKKIVRKAADLSQSAKLKNQVKWMLGNTHIAEYFPTIICEHSTDKVYYYDMEHHDMVPFFDKIHFSRIDESIEILKKVINIVFEKLYSTKNENPINKVEILKEYIQTKLISKVKDITERNEEIKILRSYESLIINNKEYINFDLIIKKILNNEKIMKSLSNVPWANNIHGDLTVDNIICSKNNEFKILDPNDENIFSSPLIDISKLYQSLNSGYEFMCDINNCYRYDNQIIFNEHTSTNYKKLKEELDKILPKYISKEDIINILFFEAIHYARMLPYKEKINERTTKLFYAIMIRLLNEFYEGWTND